MEAAAEPRGALSVEDADATATAFPTPAVPVLAGASWAHTCRAGARVGAPRRALPHLTNGASASTATARGVGVAKVR
jgi:hypothetical protein